ncbi:hypothetical protein F5B19DRAFT_501901 [Rostrohypoxylon terebratum]|nr:hypothetical protein F5B19DRAFT_501901 [Rostrohypoxylon terebratum]
MPKQLALSDLFHKGFDSGFRWNTMTLDMYDEKLKREVKKSRFLLHHPHSTHIAKVIARELNTTNKLAINKAVAELYELAADKVGECKNLEPDQFFILVKNSFPWLSKMSDAAFLAFTHKIFQARFLFLNLTLYPSEAPPPPMPLTAAVDRFYIEFKERYPTRHQDLLKIGDKINQETLEWIEGQVSWNKELRQKYWPPEITDYRSEGDGTDKLVINKKAMQRDALKSGIEIAERINESIRPMRHIPDEELFYWDTMRQDWPEWLHHRDPCPEVEDKDEDEETEEPRPAYEQIEVDTYDIIDTDDGDLPVAKKLKMMNME